MGDFTEIFVDNIIKESEQKSLAVVVSSILYI